MVSINGENYATSVYWSAGWSTGHPSESVDFAEQLSLQKISFP